MNQRGTALTKINISWLKNPDVRLIMDTLNQVRPDCARFVGGCVRDAFIPSDITDVDIATQLPPLEVEAALLAAGIRVVRTGFEHGTLTALVNETPFEITTLRKDVATDGRRAVVAFTEDWRVDAERRDFRMNALYADIDGNVYAPIDGSVEDAKNQRVAFIGDADQRLKEDYLRILRFFRFNAWYGKRGEDEGIAACTRNRMGLRQISAERIFAELWKTFRSERPFPAVEAMRDAGVLDIILPEADISKLEAVHLMQMQILGEPDPLLDIMALLPCERAVVEAVADRLKMSNEHRRRMVTWTELAHVRVIGQSDENLRALHYIHGYRPLLDHTLMETAIGRNYGELARINAVQTDFDYPAFPIGGDDLLAAGIRGPKVGQLLRALEAEWIASDFKLGRSELLERLKQTGSPTESRH